MACSNRLNTPFGARMEANKQSIWTRLLINDLFGLQAVRHHESFLEPRFQDNLWALLCVLESERGLFGSELEAHWLLIQRSGCKVSYVECTHRPGSTARIVGRDSRWRVSEYIPWPRYPIPPDLTLEQHEKRLAKAP